MRTVLTVDTLICVHGDSTGWVRGKNSCRGKYRGLRFPAGKLFAAFRLVAFAETVAELQAAGGHGSVHGEVNFHAKGSQAFEQTLPPRRSIPEH